MCTAESLRQTPHLNAKVEGGTELANTVTNGLKVIWESVLWIMWRIRVDGRALGGRFIASSRDAINQPLLDPSLQRLTADASPSTPPTRLTPVEYWSRRESTRRSIYRVITRCDNRPPLDRSLRRTVLAKQASDEELSDGSEPTFAHGTDPETKRFSLLALIQQGPPWCVAEMDGLMCSGGNVNGGYRGDSVIVLCKATVPLKVLQCSRGLSALLRTKSFHSQQAAPADKALFTLALVVAKLLSFGGPPLGGGAGGELITQAHYSASCSHTVTKGNALSANSSLIKPGSNSSTVAAECASHPQLYQTSFLSGHCPPLAYSSPALVPANL
ncbi:hypothetical protein UY3_03492 [Chelonia mydas]|uniref:Uncharacterized protein n=1 Tax=Chelonia mydas TaxID=8469 RepID=M7BQ56_CHEMY|nr:hypothetical protein UY3_03492 [Chelonia mydas]